MTTAHEAHPNLTVHAHRRCEQRAINPDYVDEVIHFGHPIKQTGGRVAYFLGERHARAAKLPAEVANLAVITARDGAVLSVIRTHDTRKLRRHAPGPIGRRSRDRGPRARRAA